MRSNILKLFQLDQDTDKGSDMGNGSSDTNLPIRDNGLKSIENCLGCDIFNSVFLLTGGSILSSGVLIRKDPKLSVTQFNRLHPRWWRAGLRFAGVGVIGLGIYRTIECFNNWQMGLYSDHDD